jgi:hypothetical protein
MGHENSRPTVLHATDTYNDVACIQTVSFVFQVSISTNFLTFNTKQVGSDGNDFDFYSGSIGFEHKPGQKYRD